MQPTTPSTISTIPTLPTELVDEILRVETHSKQDLARCCLVSKLFLPTSRKQLYNQLVLIYGPNQRDRHKFGTVVLYSTKSTTLLLDTLRQHTVLRSLPSALSINKVKLGEYVEKVGAIDLHLIETALRLVPNNKHLNSMITSPYNDISTRAASTQGQISLASTPAKYRWRLSPHFVIFANSEFHSSSAPM